MHGPATQSDLIARCSDPLGSRSDDPHRHRRRPRRVRAQDSTWSSCWPGQGHDVVDLGTDSTVAVDYPPICAAVGRAVRDGEVEVGIVLGGSGQGEQLSANKVRGVRAALCNDLYTARLARAHNDANVLAIGAGWSVSAWPTRSSPFVPRHRRSRAAATPAASARSPRSKPTSRSPPASPHPTVEDKHALPIRHRSRHRVRSPCIDRRARPARSPGCSSSPARTSRRRPCMRAVGLGAHQQVLRGLPGQALLRRQRRDRRRRGARHRAGQALFGADHANVQPHSGANANMCVYQALLEPGDTVLGLSLDHGGHLTHGSPVNASGMLYHFVAYKVTPGDERIDMDQVRDLALEHRPKMIVAGTTSYPRRLDPEPFRAIADEVGALFLFDAAHLAGLIAGGAHPTRCRSPTSSRSRRTRRCAARAAAASCRRAEHATAIDKAVFPGWQGGPLEHVIAGQGGRLPRGRRTRASPSTPSRSCATPRRWPRRWRPRASGSCRGGTDNHLMVVDLRTVRRRAHRQGGPARARRRPASR